MKKVAWILAAVFGLAFLGATLMNADLVGKNRRGLARDTEALLKPPTRYHLVLLLPDTDDSFFQGLLEGVVQAAPEVDAAVQVFRYPSSFPLEAERYFEIAMRSKVDGLIMFAPRNDRLKDRASRAFRSGVAFVPVGTDAPPGSPPGFIGSGTLLQGLEGGKRICAKLGSSARVGVILPASASEAPQDDPLYRGLASAVRSYEGAAIVALGRARPGVLSGEETTLEMLREHPEVNAILCSGSRDTMGAAQVIIDTNRVGKLLLIGADETPEIIRYIEKGVVSASIVRDSKRIGEEAVQAFARYKAEQPVKSPVEAGYFVRTTKGVSR